MCLGAFVGMSWRAFGLCYFTRTAKLLAVRPTKPPLAMLASSEVAVRPTLAGGSQDLAELGNFGRLSQVGKHVGQIRHLSSILADVLSILGPLNIWPTSTSFCRIWSNFSQTRPTSAKSLPAPADVGAPEQLFDTCCAGVGQVLSNIWTTSELAGIARG